MKVTLLTYTPQPEKIVAAAARLCYSSAGADALLDGLTMPKAEQLIAKLVEMGHFSPLEHVSFTFAVEGVSRALSHQLVRHRIASYSQKSQRYVREDTFTYIVPPAVAANSEAEQLFREQMEQIREAYQVLRGMVHHEDARYLLPNACETKLVFTMNARSLHNFFVTRCCNRAQWEIRLLAETIYQEVKKVAPMLFAAAGPACVSQGVCPEGEMTCGESAAVWEKFRKM
ncbi:MAG: FAD-dependent thymidylate synthase [Dethiobacter sp.]|jgi:thymidylate synthase (FAD)|nr:FAD-dependent thymidylate synthase [Dethiobacter sp.]MBS3897537.1 FAD-dependent thymidylate synthase [Dethiobacter sp.]MBS3982196.1 FAD-dependent thymidylate synthase [Dethiobacter sp.]MCL4463330.1 FAD-dependent thymidylate synthase [Bacillota bacterium]MCL5993540.1 FAD-dependent thymidylate synthase [Bacillota bacterium]